MIILTAAEADKVRGVSPSDNHRAIDPVPLKDGTFMLGEEVLADPAHADVKPFLAALPTVKTLDPALVYDPEKRPADSADLSAKALPSWKDAGVRKPLAGK